MYPLLNHIFSVSQFAAVPALACGGGQIRKPRSDPDQLHACLQLHCTNLSITKSTNSASGFGQHLTAFNHTLTKRMGRLCNGTVVCTSYQFSEHYLPQISKSAIGSLLCVYCGCAVCPTVSLMFRNFFGEKKKAQHD